MYKNIIKYYLSKNKKSCFLVIFFTILQGFFGAGFAIVFEKFIDFSVNIEKNSNKEKNFLIIVTILLSYIIIYALFNFLRRFFRANLIVEIDRKVKTGYFAKLLEIELNDYHKKNTGHYLSIFTEDLPAIIHDYILEYFNLLLYIFQSIFTIAVSFYINWLIALIFVLLSLFIVLYTTLFEKKFKQIRKKMSEENSKYIVSLKSFLNGFEAIKLNCSEKEFFKKYDFSLKKVNFIRRQWWRLDSIYSPGNAFLTLSLTFISIVLATLFYTKGFFSIGLLTAAIYLSTQIFNPISNIFEQITYLKANKNLSKVVFEEISSYNTEKLEKISGKIESFVLKKVSFKYNDTENYILKDIDFEIVMGKKYLLIGESGVGKSTFLKLLIGNLDYDGSVMINSKELSKIDKSSLYKFLSYVSQTSFVFNDTIRNNIDMSRMYKESEIKSVVEKVNLTDFINKNGLDRFISEEVSEVSGGEKQRICLARALINKPQILLLDEVTASLDVKNSNEIENFIINLDLTVLYVCHKVSKEIINGFDYILKFTDKGIFIYEVKKSNE